MFKKIRIFLQFGWQLDHVLEVVWMYAFVHQPQRLIQNELHSISINGQDSGKGDREGDRDGISLVMTLRIVNSRRQVHVS